MVLGAWWGLPYLVAWVGIYGVAWSLALWWVLQPTMPSNTPLPDRMHDLLPYWKQGSQWTNGVSYLLGMGTGVWGAWYHLPWIEDYLTYLFGLQLLRCAYFNSTVLPDASQKAHLKTWWQRLVTGGVRDLVFSGHVMHMYAPLWFLYQQQVLELAMFQLGCIVVTVAALDILCRRQHYTLDILVAVPVCHFMYDVVVGH